ncbi:hypothetical protein ACIPYU_09490 [Paenarthrobacter nicotinovorans]|uniref:hypothetical protein n=1 Tax=Paenarthrobacter nicotinovorans TaxID=29320 RepID=UPI0038002CDB
MRKAADLHPGSSKVDARDALFIAEAVRAMKHALKAGNRNSGGLGALKVLSDPT